jgi:GNAT superfamily N-acetyltransferase
VPPIVGFIHLIVHVIGPDDGLPAIFHCETQLVQGKIMAIFVSPEYRNRGIGRDMIHHTLRLAKALNCYQLGAFSFSDRVEVQHLMLNIGFSVRPEFRQNGQTNGLYFLMPLQIEQGVFSDFQKVHSRSTGKTGTHLHSHGAS